MDIDAIQTVLGDWTKSVLALPTQWENQPQQVQAKLPARVVLTGPINIEPVGEDYVQYPAGATNMVQPTVVGHREFDVMVRVISRSQAGNKTANFYLEKLRAALKRPSAIATFVDAGIAVLSMSQSTSFDAPFEERWESIASAKARSRSEAQRALRGTPGSATGWIRRRRRNACFLAVPLSGVVPCPTPAVPLAEALPGSCGHS